MSREAMQMTTLELQEWIKKTWEETQDIAQPKQWVGLTDKDIDECYFAARQPDFDVWAFAQEIEEVLKLKNT